MLHKAKSRLYQQYPSAKQETIGVKLETGKGEGLFENKGKEGRKLVLTIICPTRQT